jgi:Uma2 family endonuclease
MTVVAKTAKPMQWTADEFVVTDQAVFGDAWRYELVDGRVIAHDAAEPDHGALVAGVAGALVRRRSALSAGCRPEAGSAATPRSEQRKTARIPDVMVRCGPRPRVVFDVISKAEGRDWRGRDLKRQHLQAVAGVQDIVELSQDEAAAHVYRLIPGGGWLFEAVSGADAVLRLASIGLKIPLQEIYAVADIAQPPP